MEDLLNKTIRKLNERPKTLCIIQEHETIKLLEALSTSEKYNQLWKKKCNEVKR